MAFSSSKNAGNNKNKAKMKSVETWSKVVTNLFITLQQRNADLDELFSGDCSSMKGLFNSRFYFPRLI